jgi:NDP-sugar pyrophosphorylase family protein
MSRNFAAAILVGGPGTRIRAIADRLPKCLLPINGSPFLGLLIRKLLREGCDEVALILGYGERTIRDYALAEFDDVPFSYGVCRAGTGGAILTALQLLCYRSDVLCLNGDTIIDIDYGSVVRHHRALKPKATIVTTDLPNVPNEGAVHVDENGRVRAFTEGAIVGTTDSYPNSRKASNCGIYCLQTRLKTLSAFRAGSNFERDILPLLVSTETVMALSNATNLFVDFGTPSRYQWINSRVSDLRSLYPTSLEDR